MNSMIIDIRNLTYIINDKPLFSNLNIRVKENTITFISGNNNCGKTTLLRIISEQKNENIKVNNISITDYSKEEIEHIIQIVFPLNTFFKEELIIDELTRDTDCPKDKILFLMSELNLNDVRNRRVKDLSNKEIIKLQIAKAIAYAKNVVIIDELDRYFTNNEIKELLLLFKDCINKYDLSFIITTTSLENTIYGDELYIINDKKIILKGDPIEVLQKDNIINKAGLKIPFMIDLSVKLGDYELVNKIELNKERLINILWKSE